MSCAEAYGSTPHKELRSLTPVSPAPEGDCGKGPFMVQSVFLCEIIFCQFLEERQLLGNFSYRF